MNRTMDRDDLLTEEAKPVVDSINRLISKLYSKGLYMTSWNGTLPEDEKTHLTRHSISWTGLKKLITLIFGKKGIDWGNRGPEYKPLANAVDDRRIPWYLYWEILWVMKNGPQITKDMRLLDAGGTSSLFSCYLTSLGSEVHSVDINEKLVSNGNNIARAMGWNLHSYPMDMRKLSFPDEYFDHAYSICVFEHLNYETKQQALNEIARCLKPNGILSITFDYRNPAPFISGLGSDQSQSNQLGTIEDVQRNFLSTKHFKLVGNQVFQDNGKSFLIHPQFGNCPYTFGAIFLKKT